MYYRIAQQARAITFNASLALMCLLHIPHACRQDPGLPHGRRASLPCNPRRSASLTGDKPVRGSSGVGPVTGASSSIRVRRLGDAIDVVPLADTRLQLFDSAVPWREFRWYKKQQHFSGWYWSATMEAPVGYESRLEYANLLLLDFDQQVEWILSQPFLLTGDDRGKTRKHIPDYLFSQQDGSVCVMDVKPAAKLSLPKVRDSLGWSRRVIEKHGWEYRVLSEPDPTVLANVQFLAGYRRASQFDGDEVTRAAAVLNNPQTLGEAVRTVTPITGDARFARSLVLHLLWNKQLRTDLSELLSSTNIVEPT